MIHFQINTTADPAETAQAVVRQMRLRARIDPPRRSYIIPILVVAIVAQAVALVCGIIASTSF